MPKSTKPLGPVTAAQVRAFYLDPKHGASRVARLPEGTNLAFIGEKQRGRIPPAARALFNKGKPEARQYVEGNTNAVRDAAKAEAARLRALAVEQGVVKAGSVGPLPKAFLIAQGVIKG
jgi:hypothetical protein